MAARYLRLHYLSALNHTELVDRIWREGRPDTYEPAMDFAACYEADELNVKAHVGQCSRPQTEHFEEPMDINATTLAVRENVAADVNAIGGARPKRPITNQRLLHQPTNSPPTPSSHNQNTAIDNMQRQLNGWSKQFTALMSKITSSQHQPTSANHLDPQFRRSPSRPSAPQQRPRFHSAPMEYTMDGRPTCLYCKNPGHASYMLCI